MKYRFFRIMAVCLLLALLLCGCAGKAEQETLPVETTEATVPPTIPADGNPDDVTCKGSYSADAQDVRSSANLAVATVGGEKLTLSQLQVYYGMEIAAFRAAGLTGPDFAQSLDTQLCDIDDTATTWQQYFLQRALDTWHANQALVSKGIAEGTPVEESWLPREENHAKYLSVENNPALKYLYGYYNKSYAPNDKHQAYLDTLPQLLEELAAANGFESLQAQARDIAGEGVDAEDFAFYADLYNRGYMYFTELTYYLELTEEEVAAYFDAHAADYQQLGITRDSGSYVDMRHILLVPEGAEVDADGTVTASEEAWAACLAKAEDLLKQWQRAKDDDTFSELAFAHSADAGSRLNGGLYSNIRPGQMTGILDGWCFDDARLVGDTGIVRSQYGYHVLYLRSTRESWLVHAEYDLRLEKTKELIPEAKKAYPMTVSYDKILLGQGAQTGEAITAEQLLYADVGHERFPSVPVYLQQDFSKSPFGAYKVSSHGCGITALAMMATYMTDTELTPHELAARYGRYCGKHGSDISMFDKTPAEIGFHLQGRSYTWDEVQTALENGQMVITLQRAGHFTRSGHFLVLSGLTEDNLVVVRDSNMYNYRRLEGHKIDGFKSAVITPTGSYYWIYAPKVTHIPACVRCGGDSGVEVTASMFSQDYYCPKCCDAMQRRGEYLNVLTSR